MQHPEDNRKPGEDSLPPLPGDQLELELDESLKLHHDEQALRESTLEREHYEAEWAERHDYTEPDSGFAYDYVQQTPPSPVLPSATVSGSAPTKNAYRFKKASDVKEETVPWLWVDRIAYGCLTILDGDPGVGKTTIALDLMARLSRGAPMPFETIFQKDSNSLVVSVEDSIAYTIVPRLRSAGANLERVNVLIDFPLFPSGLDRLRSTIKETKAKLVMVDPGLAMFDSAINPNSDAETRRVVGGLAGLAADCEAAIIFVRHLNKNLTNPRAMYRGGGSIAISATARSGLVAAYSKQQNALTLASYKSSLSLIPPTLTYKIVSDPDDPKRISRIEWLAEISLTADEVLDPGLAGPMPLQAQERKDRALQQQLTAALKIIGDRGATAAELKDMVKKRHSAVKEALDELVSKALVKYEEEKGGTRGRPKGVYRLGDGPLNDEGGGPQEDFDEPL